VIVVTRDSKVLRRLRKKNQPTLENWRRVSGPAAEKMQKNVTVDMGWGRLFFGQTFASINKMASMLREEQPGQRDIVMYLRDPHVLLSSGPQEFFLDPSHTYRLYAHDYRPPPMQPRAFRVRRLVDISDAAEINRIYTCRHMVACDPHFLLRSAATKLHTYFVAELRSKKTILGTVTGVDHVEAFGDFENGSSLWCLAVDPHANVPGVGEALVRQLVEHSFARGRDYVDLSVMHDNAEAIALYEKLGFQRVPVFCVKTKNAFNEPLFTAPSTAEPLNPYAEIILNEARRRGIHVQIIDADNAVFVLSHGGTRVRCRESLTDMTTSISHLLCDDKRLSREAFVRAGLMVPPQIVASDIEGRVVVKPARGEQGAGVSVDIDNPLNLAKSVSAARRVYRDVLIERFVEGKDLRVIVINDEVVAAAVRMPPAVTGTGKHTVRQLIRKYSRRRSAATGGESKVPIDAETKRSIEEAGLTLDSVLPSGDVLVVRKTANLHTGGTIHDVTDELHPDLVEVCKKAAAALEIPVVGLDLIVRDPSESEYVLIEANERPGLANHEPQPTAERFIDMLFPQTIRDAEGLA
jgi:GNAT-family acetyltransferase (TIGR03103 family)